jgi:hypothetical protein
MTDETVSQAPASETPTHEVSMMDRIAAQFSKVPAQSPPNRGLPRAEATPDTAEEGEGESTHDLLDWEGEQLTIPKSLKAAVMQHKDYTQKTQELAEQRRAYDLARESVSRAQLDSQFANSVSEESRELNVIDSYLKEVNKLNWSQMSTEQMLRTRAELDQVKERRDTLKAAVQGKRAEYDKAVQAKIAEVRAKSREIAAKSIPGFTEETEKAIRAHALAEGLSEAETDSVLMDPRSTKVLWKAMQFDKVQASTGKAQKEISRTLKTTPRGEPMPASKAAELNFRKAMKGAQTSGQKASLIEDRLARGSIFNPKGH